LVILLFIFFPLLIFFKQLLIASVHQIDRVHDCKAAYYGHVSRDLIVAHIAADDLTYEGLEEQKITYYQV